MDAQHPLRSRFLPLLVVAAAALGAGRLDAQSAWFVTNLNFASAGSLPLSPLLLGEDLLFTADDGLLGRELWILRARGPDDTDPVPGAGSPRLVKDIFPGPFGSLANQLNRFGDRALFVAWDGVHGVEPWITDGTAAGTALVADIEPGPDNSFPRDFVVFGHEAFFSARSTEAGWRVWRTDGTPHGTRLFSVLNPGGEPVANPRSLTKALGALFFVAEGPGGATGIWRLSSTGGTAQLLLDSVPGDSPQVIATDGHLYFAFVPDQLWATDGSPAGTVRLSSSGQPLALGAELEATAFGARLVFQATDGSTGLEPWTSDGTVHGTRRLADIHPGGEGSDASAFFAWNGTVYFGASDPQHGRELWRTDGTTAGTQLVLDLNEGERSSLVDRFIATGDRLFFRSTAYGGCCFLPMEVIGTPLWATDGTATGTYEVAPVAQDSGFDYGFFSPATGTVIGDRLFFYADDGEHGREVWVSDGTPEGTRMVKDIRPGPRSFGFSRWIVEFDGEALFVAANNVVGAELWQSDGTEAGTRPLEVRVDKLEGSFPRTLAGAGANALFSTYREPGGVWRSDGTRRGTIELWAGDTVHEIAELDGEYFFLPDYAAGLSRIDPETGATERVPSRDGIIARGARGLVRRDGVLYFVADGSDGGSDALWRSAGTSEETFILKDFEAFEEDGWRSNFAPLATSELVFFSVDPRPSTTSWLWRSDGTEDGTFVLAEFETSPFVESPRELTRLGDRVLFTAFSGQVERLWTSDGTFAGTHPVFSPGPAQPFASAVDLTAVGDRIFFVAETPGPVSTRELWITDGTPAGTSRVEALPEEGCPPDLLGRQQELVAHQGRLYYSALDCARGDELWTSDGTPAGTTLVRDIHPGAASSRPRELTSVEGGLVFSAESPDSGRELWFSDGTDAGTRRIRDLHPGAGSSDPRDFRQIGRQVFFAADDGFHGHEPWVLRLPGYLQPLEVVVEPPGAGYVQSARREIACPPDCSEDFLFDSTVRLETRPERATVFSSWSGPEACGEGEVLIRGPTQCVAHFRGCSPTDLLALAGLTVTTPRSYVSCGTIRGGPLLAVEPAGELRLEAAAVVFDDGVEIGLGGLLTVELRQP